MGIEQVVFYSTSDREDQKGVIKKYTMDGQAFSFILKRERSWGDLYDYLGAVCKIEDVKEIPE